MKLCVLAGFFSGSPDGTASDVSSGFASGRVIATPAVLFGIAWAGAEGFLGSDRGGP